MSTFKNLNAGGLIKLPQNSTVDTSSQRRQDGITRKKPATTGNQQSGPSQSHHHNSIQVLLNEARQIEKQLSKLISRRPTAQSSQLIFRYR